MIKKLKDLYAGEKAVVTAVHGHNRQRILEMGITAGTVILVRRIAPFGDPREVVVRGYSLLLSNAESDNILIDRCQEVNESS